MGEVGINRVSFVEMGKIGTAKLFCFSSVSSLFLCISIKQLTVLFLLLTEVTAARFYRPKPTNALWLA